MYASGVWIVKEGREDEFKRRWQAGADGVSLEFPEVKFMLLRDSGNPRRFVSLSEGWRNAEQIDAARNSPGFQASMEATSEVLESAEMSILELAIEVS